MNRIVSVAVASAIALTLTIIASFSFAVAETGDDIVILYTNDVHCAIDDYIGYDGLALYKKEMQALHKHVVLVDAGDALQGGKYGAFGKGEHIVKLMNAVPYDVAGLGNHEFDYTLETLKERAKTLSCGYVCCNFIDRNTGIPFFEPYKIFDFGEKQIAFIGVVTPETFTSSVPSHFRNEKGEVLYSFCEEDGQLCKVIQANVDKAREEGADYVVLIAHLGENDPKKNEGVQKPGTVTISGRAENDPKKNEGVQKWSAQEVVRKTEGVDAVIDAHSHVVMQEQVVNNKIGKQVTITQTGTQLKFIGKMTISENEGIKTELINRVPAPEASMGLDDATMVVERTIVTRSKNGEQEVEVKEQGDVYVDKNVNESISELRNNPELLRPVARLDFGLYANDPATGNRRIRHQETNLSDLDADALRWRYGARIAIHNGGGLRNDIKLRENDETIGDVNLYKGDITYGDVLDVLPFGSTVVVVEITGRQILDCLELGANEFPKEDNGAFLSAVSGITYTIDASVKSTVKLDDFGNFKCVEGERRVKDVMIVSKDDEQHYEPLDLDETYTLCSNSYLLKDGGDGYGPIFKDCKSCKNRKVYKVLVDEGEFDADVFIQYLQHLNYKDPKGKGRIKVINGISKDNSDVSKN